MHSSRWMAAALAAILMAGATTAQAQKQFDPGKGFLTRWGAVSDPKDASHSHFGKAFDQGPRQRARPLRGIGNVHFSVTTARPEAQRYIDQGVNLLFSFAWFEAERAFRHAAMLDPDCAMAYWGMAMADSGRGKEFIKIAQQKMGRATDRERRYIEALAIVFREGGDDKARAADNVRALERLTLAYPDDLEAKAILAWTLNGQQYGSSVSNKVAIDALLRQVLLKSPLHPGAHHYRIHLWDGQDAAQALDSAKSYAKAAPGIGHAQHMPGHIYAQLGMWEQAAYAMDAAARVERRYFYAVGRLPWESWNYAHDQHYLIANLGYMGRIAEGVRLAQELLDVPRDPQFNSPSGNTCAGQGRFAMLRMRVRGERWDDILNDPDPGGSVSGEEKGWNLYSRGMAHLGKGSRAEARKVAEELEKLNLGGDAMQCARLELRGRLDMAEGKFGSGLESLQKAADIEKQRFAYNDPGPYPRPLYESLAWGYLAAQKYAEAETTLREGLQRAPNNGFALCLLAEVCQKAGKRAESEAAWEEMHTAWKNADADLPMLRRALALGLGRFDACGVEMARFPTPYSPPRELERLGPARWQPFPGADFSVTDPNGKTVRLADFRGRNLLLVFYLGGSCPHCMKQLEALSKEKATFDTLDTQIVAVSADSPAMNKRFLVSNPDYPLRLLSDANHAAARKYAAYDEFEALELHTTALLDGQGRVWWFRSGTEPFVDFKFLQSEIGRMKAWEQRAK